MDTYIWVQYGLLEQVQGSIMYGILGDMTS